MDENAKTNLARLIDVPEREIIYGSLAPEGVFIGIASECSHERTKKAYAKILTFIEKLKRENPEVRCLSWEKPDGD